MADRLTLSCWLKSFSPLSAPHNWEKLLRLFPHSKLSQAHTTLRIHAVNWNEPVLYEAAYPQPLPLAEIVRASHEFACEDAAWQLETAWDLLVPDNNDDFHLTPVPLSLWCFAPAFENETSDHLRIDFGLEDTFLPFPSDASIRASHANLQSLMHLVKEIATKLPIARNHLWSESGVNFAKKLEAAVAGPSGLALQ